jgi:hypothetical protein
MHETGHVFSPSFLELCLALEVEFMECSINTSFHTDFFRALYLQQWLESRLNEIDRVFYFDAFDAFFQRDPFENLIVGGSMTFVGEGMTVRHQWGNYRWLRGCIGFDVAEAMLDFPVICSGTVAGDARIYYQFLGVLLSNLTLWRSCTYDQPQINFLVWSGAFERAGVPSQILGCNGSVNGMVECPADRIYFDGQLFDVASGSTGRPSAVIHHYNKRKEILRNCYARCGVDLPSMTDVPRKR